LQEFITPDDVIEFLAEKTSVFFDTRMEELGPELFKELQKSVLLQVVDTKWREHLYEMDYLREGIGLRAIGQRDPLIEYQTEGYTMFQSMIESIQEDFTRYIFHAQLVDETRQQVEMVAEGRGESPAAAAASQPVSRAADPKSAGKAKVGRNDPCICGSGKKYKKCCGA